MTSNRFETFSFLPPLSPAQAQAQAEYLLENNWVPTIEYAEAGETGQMFWQLWPIVAPRSENHRVKAGDVNASLLMMQLDACSRRHPLAFVRLSGYDTTRRVQAISFIVHTPNEAAS